MGGIRLFIVTEGDTEEAFVRELLCSHLAPLGVPTTPWYAGRRTRLGRKAHGVPEYAQLGREVRALLKQQRSNDVRVSTMLDYYGLPTGYPGERTDPGDPAPPRRRVEALEKAMSEDIADWRFIPYLQMHESEALLLADPQSMVTAIPVAQTQIDALIAHTPSIDDPELIDGGASTHPSARILRHIPAYDKPTWGVRAARDIGLPTMRARCPHFAQWIEKLEALGAEEGTASQA